jgi:hypothetical protein
MSVPESKSQSRGDGSRSFWWLAIILLVHLAAVVTNAWSLAPVSDREAMDVVQQPPQLLDIAYRF